ncbi:MAG: M48 family metallopeptidase, partial [Acidobacteriota bacterium]
MSRWVVLVVLVACGLLAGAASAQEGDPSTEPAEGSAIHAEGFEESGLSLEAESGASDTSEPFDPATATEAYLAQLTPEQRERSDSYFEGGYWLQLWGFLYGLGVAWLLLAKRLSAKMRDLGEKVSRFKPVQTAVYAVQYVLLSTVLGFPLTVYQGFYREHQYDLATQTFGAWFGEQMIGLVIGLVLMPILLVILYGVFRRAPRTWWLWGAGVALVFLVLMLLISPVFIAPLFNDYVALEDPAVVEPILSMARSNGVAVDNVYQFDASRQSTRVSANVSGIFGTMRISLNDNLLERCDLAGVRAVMGHEIGHYVLNHIYESILFFGVVLVLGFAFVRFTYDRILACCGER